MKLYIPILAGSLVLGGAIALPGMRASRQPAIDAADDGALTASIEFFEEKMRIDPNSRAIGSRLADRYVLRFQRSAQLEDLARAEALVRKGMAISMDPSSDHARLSTLLLMQHRFVEAGESARKAVDILPTNDDARGALFDATLAAGDYETAETLLAMSDQDALGWRVRRAQWLDMHGSGDEAARMMSSVCDRLERAGTRAEVRAWCLTELAGMRHGANGPDAATATLKEALAVLPGYRGAIEGLADLAHANGQWKKALKLYEAIATDAHPDLYLRLAEVHVQLGDTQAAADNERRFLTIARVADKEALYALPLALYYGERQMTVDTALAIMGRDLERRSAVESYDVMSWLLLAKGRAADALVASDMAFAWGAPSPTMLYHRAEILHALGRSAEADVLRGQALAEPSLLDPHVRLISSSHKTRPAIAVIPD